MRSLISIDFPAPEMVKAHMWYQLSPFPSFNVAICDHPGNIHQSFAAPRCSATRCCVLIQVHNVIDTISKRWRNKKAFKLHFPIFLSRFLLHPVLNLYYLLITGLTEKIMIHVLAGLKTSVGVYKGKGGQQGAVEYSIQSFKWKPATCAKTHTLRNSKKHLK